jgi:hypothetical protein
MRRSAFALLALGLLAGPAHAFPLCRRVGTQLECGIVSLGTQHGVEPPCTGPVYGIAGCGGLLGDQARADAPFGLKLQDVGGDPALCRTFGNETYCE